MRKNGPILYRIVMQYMAARFGLRQMAFDRLRDGERPRAVDVNARPTTSIIGIAKVMQEEIGELILHAMFGGDAGGVCDWGVQVRERRLELVTGMRTDERGEIPELRGVWAIGKTLEECRENLRGYRRRDSPEGEIGSDYPTH